MSQVPGLLETRDQIVRNLNEVSCVQIRIRLRAQRMVVKGPEEWDLTHTWGAGFDS